MRVTTNVTVDYVDEKGRRNLPPGFHNLKDEVANELIEKGLAVKGGKAQVEEGDSAPPSQLDTTLISGTVAEIEEALSKGGFSTDHLKALKKAENAGEKRVGVFTALEKAFAAAAAK